MHFVILYLHVTNSKCMFGTLINVIETSQSIAIYSMKRSECVTNFLRISTKHEVHTAVMSKLSSSHIPGIGWVALLGFAIAESDA